jgi:hypothetical protein
MVTKWGNFLPDFRLFPDTHALVIAMNGALIILARM